MSQSVLPRRCIFYTCMWERLSDIFIYYFSPLSPPLIYASVADNYRPIVRPYLWQAWESRGILSRVDKVKDLLPWRRWIRRRISLALRIYGRLYSSFLSSTPRSMAHNLRYRKIDVVDSPTIHAAFVTTLVVASIVEIWKFYLPSPGICVQKALREMAHLKAT